MTTLLDEALELGKPLHPPIISKLHSVVHADDVGPDAEYSEYVYLVEYEDIKQRLALAVRALREADVAVMWRHMDCAAIADALEVK